MTVQECYKAVNGNYEEALGRMMKDELIKKFLVKFLNDQSFDRLCEAMEAKNYEQGFKEAHTLKGVSGNLALTGLFQASDRLTEDLRDGKGSENSQAYMEETKREYEIAKAAIQELQNS